ncbi:hypothetical protein, partial [Maricaulis sp.]
AQACIREKWEWEEKDALMLPPDLFRGLAAFQMQAQPGPGAEAGGSGGGEEKRKCGVRQRDGTANFAKAVATCS